MNVSQFESEQTLKIKGFSIFQSLSKSLDFQGAVLDTKSNLTCQCQSATHDLWRVQYELNLARARIKQLESRLEAYGIESNQNK